LAAPPRPEATGPRDRRRRGGRCGAVRSRRSPGGVPARGPRAPGAGRSGPRSARRPRRAARAGPAPALHAVPGRARLRGDRGRAAPPARQRRTAAPRAKDRLARRVPDPPAGSRAVRAAVRRSAALAEEGGGGGGAPPPPPPESTARDVPRGVLGLGARGPGQKVSDTFCPPGLGARRHDSARGGDVRAGCLRRYTEGVPAGAHDPPGFRTERISARPMDATPAPDRPDRDGRRPDGRNAVSPRPCARSARGRSARPRRLTWRGGRPPDRRRRRGRYAMRPPPGHPSPPVRRGGGGGAAEADVAPRGGSRAPRRGRRRCSPGRWRR
jgi:hypothetical protein